MKHAGGEYVDLGEGDEGVEGEGGEGDAELEAEKLSRLRRDVLDDLEIPGSPGVEVRIWDKDSKATDLRSTLVLPEVQENAANAEHLSSKDTMQKVDSGLLRASHLWIRLDYSGIR